MKLERKRAVSIIKSLVIVIIMLIFIMVFGINTHDVSIVILGILGGLLPVVALSGFAKEETPTIEEISEFGRPYNVFEGIYNYNSRSELPNFNVMLSKATRTIDILSITSLMITLGNIEPIRNAVDRGIKVTFLILNPASQHVLTQSQIFHGAKSLGDQIKQSLDVLCTEKQKLENDNLSIRTYDSLIRHNLIIIDQGISDNAWIKIEEYVVGSDSNSRPNHCTYEKNNAHFFNRHLREYNSILQESNVYNCHEGFDTKGIEYSREAFR